MATEKLIKGHLLAVVVTLAGLLSILETEARESPHV